MSMKRLAFLMVFIVLFSFWTNAQGSLQTSIKVNSSGTVEYSTQSLVIKHFTINAYGIFDTTVANYAELYDMSEAGTELVSYLTDIKALKPSFKALYYWNMRSVTNNAYQQEAWDACVANDWFLRTSDGGLIEADIGYLVKFGDFAFQAWMANWLKTKITALGYDGVFADNCLSWGRNEYCWGCDGTPINPDTGVTYTDAEIRADLVAYHTAVKNAIGSKLLCCNGIFGGYRFYDHQNEYQEILSASPLDGFMSEGAWYPNYDNPQWMSEQTWQEAIEFLGYVQDSWLLDDSSRFYVPVCKLAKGNQVHTSLPSGCTIEQMATYAYSSTLLGVETATATQVYFSTFLSTSDLQSIGMKLLYDAPIGTPTNNYYKITGTSVYSRDFSNAKVLVNPTSSSFQIVLPSNTYETLEGSPVSTFTIPAHTGVILSKL